MGHHRLANRNRARNVCSEQMMGKKIILLADERVRIPRVVVASLSICCHHDSSSRAGCRADPYGHVASLPPIDWARPALIGAQLLWFDKECRKPFPSLDTRPREQLSTPVLFLSRK